MTGGLVTATDPPQLPGAGIRFEKIEKRYGGLFALRRVSLEVAAGECVALAGRNGSGKTTLLRIAAGLVRPSSGAVQFTANGQASREGKPQTGFVAHATMVYDELTAEENLMLFARLQGIMSPDKLVEQLLREVGLLERRGSLVRTFSRGMRQRVAIARTLALRPNIILMDEPFGALDPFTRFNMQDQLVALWREREETVFFVTHSVEEAVYLGDRVYVLSPGPGTLVREIPLPGPEKPAREMQREKAFTETVFEIRDIIEKLEASKPAGT